MPKLKWVKNADPNKKMKNTILINEEDEFISLRTIDDEIVSLSITTKNNFTTINCTKMDVVHAIVACIKSLEIDIDLISMS